MSLQGCKHNKYRRTKMRKSKTEKDKQQSQFKRYFVPYFAIGLAWNVNFFILKASSLFFRLLDLAFSAMTEILSNLFYKTSLSEVNYANTLQTSSISNTQ